MLNGSVDKIYTLYAINYRARVRLPAPYLFTYGIRMSVKFFRLWFLEDDFTTNGRSVARITIRLNAFCERQRIRVATHTQTRTGKHRRSLLTATSRRTHRTLSTPPIDTNRPRLFTHNASRHVTTPSGDRPARQSADYYRSSGRRAALGFCNQLCERVEHVDPLGRAENSRADPTVSFERFTMTS
ncbi:hypothetical protein EVAR_3674_1 [Eumeta japonica]|uniref:Uncharacterized protein n=1 Tax=Eumeta variegata TaxID=151549 RepID=A0A4C1SRH1_EUMVA|nr:hypothetical protein EVAR_3674_1 [Eumeta japonica]